MGLGEWLFLFSLMRWSLSNPKGLKRPNLPDDRSGDAILKVLHLAVCRYFACHAPPWG
ncbi:hypothetical protein HAX54_006476, partial [Datura stramonium]|nr:hypothetical protein [Datura stramonium]